MIEKRNKHTHHIQDNIKLYYINIIIIISQQVLSKQF